MLQFKVMSCFVPCPSKTRFSSGYLGLSCVPKAPQSHLSQPSKLELPKYTTLMLQCLQAYHFWENVDKANKRTLMLSVRCHRQLAVGHLNSNHKHYSSFSRGSLGAYHLVNSKFFLLSQVGERCPHSLLPKPADDCTILS